MKKIILGFLANILILFNVLAGEIETKKVISTGVGITESEALKDATRNAVQQVVGVYILTDTYSKNSQIIKDDILVNSNGYVKTFKLISQSKDTSGLFRIEAEIEVEPGKVSKRLEELNIAMKDIAKIEIKALSLDKLQAAKEFEKMFNEVIIKPMVENKKIYDIKIGELKNVEKFPKNIYYQSHGGNDESREKVRNGQALPFLLSFSIDFNKEYIDLVELFLKKASSEIYNNEVEARNFYGETLLFKKMYFDNVSDYSPKFLYAYKFNDLNAKVYRKIVSSIIERPNLMINFFDSKKQLYKTITYDGYYVKSDIDCDRPKIIDKNHSSESVFGFNKNSGLQFDKETKNINIAMYLSEEDITNIKSTSIEIKFLK